MLCIDCKIQQPVLQFPETSFELAYERELIAELKNKMYDNI